MNTPLEITIVLTVANVPYLWTGDYSDITNEVPEQAGTYVTADFESREGQAQFAKLVDTYEVHLTPETAEMLKASDHPEAPYLLNYPTWDGNLNL